MKKLFKFLCVLFVSVFALTGCQSYSTADYYGILTNHVDLETETVTCFDYTSEHKDVEDNVTFSYIKYDAKKGIYAMSKTKVNYEDAYQLNYEYWYLGTFEEDILVSASYVERVQNGYNKEAIPVHGEGSYNEVVNLLKENMWCEYVAPASVSSIIESGSGKNSAFSTYKITYIDGDLSNVIVVKEHAGWYRIESLRITDRVTGEYWYYTYKLPSFGLSIEDPTLGMENPVNPGNSSPVVSSPVESSPVTSETSSSVIESSEQSTNSSTVNSEA